MKRINQFAGKMLVGAIAVAMLAMASAVSAEEIQQAITVVQVKGNARYSPDSSMKNWVPLKKGDVLKPGALIQTAEDGTVDVLLGDKKGGFGASTMSASGPTQVVHTDSDAGPKANVVRIFPSSVLSVDKLTLDKTGADEVAETQLDLRAGKIMGNVKKLSAASRYEVKIPNGVAGIRGTTFMIGANGTVYVLTGSVVISYMNPQGQLVTQTIQAGYSYDAFAANPTVNQLSTAVLNALQHNATTMGSGQTGPITLKQNGTTVYVSPY